MRHLWLSAVVIGVVLLAASAAAQKVYQPKDQEELREQERQEAKWLYIDTKKLKRENAKGADIYIRPAGEQNPGLILVDDLNQAQLERMKAKGVEPAAVVETSPMNCQAWVRLTDHPLSPEVATTLVGSIRFCCDDPVLCSWMGAAGTRCATLNHNNLNDLLRLVDTTAHPLGFRGGFVAG